MTTELARHAARFENVKTDGFGYYAQQSIRPQQAYARSPAC
ncbi:hypothetical protein HD597_000799 [Nonomuraea thailandensis]|uniref:Uncharacterized protein n=1 Tax=Nonomuraea thailandensis TaxID=1188745 RepID=A0A9X2GAG8_9ACTN|nr:hypothetical protein [Nonomuraea thailandensis]MCP2353779.1 hypothetical protein [Nonomuraea thailandensis]